MRIVCIGGGPGGLYFAALMKKANPRHHIRVVERNRPDETFGFGVVFSDATMAGIAEADREAGFERGRNHTGRPDGIERRIGGVRADAGSKRTEAVDADDHAAVAAAGR